MRVTGEIFLLKNIKIHFLNIRQLLNTHLKYDVKNIQSEFSFKYYSIILNSQYLFFMNTGPP